jgi:pSer/pThr/pTyr-binding forkhead associated (FHA) protein
MRALPPSHRGGGERRASAGVAFPLAPAPFRRLTAAGNGRAGRGRSSRDNSRAAQPPYRACLAAERPTAFLPPAAPRTREIQKIVDVSTGWEELREMVSLQARMNHISNGISILARRICHPRPALDIIGKAEGRMPDDSAHPKAWLVSQSDAQVGVRYLITRDVTCIGRASDNDLVLEGSDAVTVSLHHLAIHRENGGFRVRDLDSTNGTFVDGERVKETELRPPAVIRFSAQGPQLSLVLEEPTPIATLDSTQVVTASALAMAASATPTPGAGTYDGLLSEAVERAREARSRGRANETMTIMRDALHQALWHTRRRFRMVILALAVGLLAVSAAAAWKVRDLNAQKHAIDERIQDIEKRLQQSSPADTERLVNQLDAYEGQAEHLQQDLLYRVEPHPQDFVTEEIRKIMEEFGSEVYSVPPELIERVKYYMEQFHGRDRPLVDKAFGYGGQYNTVRQLLEQEHLPPDLAYVPLVESALGDGQSAAGAVGLWQFTAATAKAYGMRVDDTVDERLDVNKSTQAACRYLRELILDFGSGSSVMLALAAYNLGPGKVKRAVIKTVQDPIKQRNFWSRPPQAPAADFKRLP